MQYHRIRTENGAGKRIRTGGRPLSNIIEGITKDLKEIPKNLKAKAGGMDTKKLVLLNLPYISAGYFCDKVAWLWRVSEGTNM